MKTIEIELRYGIVDSSQLSDFTAKLQHVSTKRVVDVYLDTQDADLIRKGIYIRIRDNKKVDIKFNRECIKDPTLELQPYCEEYSFALPFRESDLGRLNEILHIIELNTLSNANFELLKQANQLIEHRIVDKMRKSYKADEFKITVDEVVNLGTFLEIELMAEDTSSLEMVKKAMEQSLQGLALRPLKTGYDSLILRKQNFAQYLQGRFVLEEDKKYRIQV